MWAPVDSDGWKLADAGSALDLADARVVRTVDGALVRQRGAHSRRRDDRDREGVSGEFGGITRGQACWTLNRGA